MFTKTPVQLKDLQYGDIERVELLRYPKRALKTYMEEKYGTDDDKLRKLAKELREDYDSDWYGGPYARLRIGSGAWLTLSGGKAECPVNLVIPYDDLKRLPGAALREVRAAGRV